MILFAACLMGVALVVTLLILGAGHVLSMWLMHKIGMKESSDD